MPNWIEKNVCPICDEWEIEDWNIHFILNHNSDSRSSKC